MPRKLIRLLVSSVCFIGVCSCVSEKTSDASSAIQTSAEPKPANVSNSFQDCSNCPEMVVVPGGVFSFGAKSTDPEYDADEGPQQQVTIQSFAVSRFEITREQFAAFVESGYTAAQGCLVMQENGRWSFDQQASWLAPGFDQGDRHPVVCLTWSDARAYVDWLNSQVNGSPYRLLSESEWEYSARAGSTSRYWWGDNENDFCDYTNGVDQSAREAYPFWERAGACNDGFVYTAPVGHFQRANAFGLEDLVGNVWEWVDDCHRQGLDNQPANGAPYQQEPCERRVLRGGAWGDYGSFYLRSTYRGAWRPDIGFGNLGLRVAKSIHPEN